VEVLIEPDTSYQTLHPTFHQFIEVSSGIGVGLFFKDELVACKFAENMQFAIESLKKPKTPSFQLKPMTKSPDEVVTKEDLDEYKQEMFQAIDTWKMEIITEIKRKKNQ